MAESSIYQDIAKRTGGDIYIGVVGPVRSGKSTFIHRFLETAVLPNIENEYERARARDEAPQSAAGKTIMTTEPKFVPDEAVKITVDGDALLRVKLIDCVGYLVEGALGADEEGECRMVKTPWCEGEISFEAAAELGTAKVIGEHSTIAVLVTTDGSFTDIPRENYVIAEERAVKELRAQGKPFCIVLNSSAPESDAARSLAASLEEKYSAPVALVDCTALGAVDVREILGLVLAEFPIRCLKFRLPEWCEALPREHRLQSEALAAVMSFTDGMTKLGEIDKRLANTEKIQKCSLNAGLGTAEFEIPVSDEEYYKTLSELCSLEIKNEKGLFETVSRLASVEREYSKIESALRDVNERGYGIVMPEPEDMELEEPKMTRQAGGWGVKLSAKANSIHLIRAELKTELCPVVGTEEQTEEVAKYLKDEYDSENASIWESNMFGKSIYDLVKDGMHAKLQNIPDESRARLGEMLERVVNEGANGLICILL